MPKFCSMPLLRHSLFRASLKSSFGGNITGGAAKYLIEVLSLTPLSLQAASQRYRIFYGAPPHLIGKGGQVNKALPPRKLSLMTEVL